MHRPKFIWVTYHGSSYRTGVIDPQSFGSRTTTPLIAPGSSTQNGADHDPRPKSAFQRCIPLVEPCSRQRRPATRDPDPRPGRPGFLATMVETRETKSLHRPAGFEVSNNSRLAHVFLAAHGVLEEATCGQPARVVGRPGNREFYPLSGTGRFLSIWSSNYFRPKYHCS